MIGMKIAPEKRIHLPRNLFFGRPLIGEMLYYYGNDVSPKSLYMFKGEEEESSYVLYSWSETFPGDPVCKGTSSPSLLDYTFTQLRP
jgi:hypothetical protein